MPKWKGTFDFDIDSYELDGGEEHLFTDGKKTYEVVFGVKGSGYQEGYYSRGTLYDRWGDPGDAPESEIEDAGIYDYEFTYCQAYEVDDKGEVISEDPPYLTVFIDNTEGIDLDNCGEKAKALFNSLRTVGKKSYSIIEEVELILDEFCWDTEISDIDYD